MKNSLDNFKIPPIETHSDNFEAIEDFSPGLKST